MPRHECERCGARYAKGGNDPDICPDCVEIVNYLERVPSLPLWEPEEDVHDA